VGSDAADSSASERSAHSTASLRAFGPRLVDASRRREAERYRVDRSPCGRGDAVVKAEVSKLHGRRDLRDGSDFAISEPLMTRRDGVKRAVAVRARGRLRAFERQKSSPVQIESRLTATGSRMTFVTGEATDVRRAMR
jgi:hypothetical protein